MPSECDRCPPGLGLNLEFAISADPKLVAQGWVRRFLADPARAKEAVDIYSSLGYEVKAQKLSPEDFGAMCGNCSSTICNSHVMIYTRKPGDSKNPAS